jgi:hypothetical protein
MKIMWCWRCKQEVPMLNEDEYNIIAQLYKECCDKSIQCERKGLRCKINLNQLFKPVVNEYERITGMKDSHHNAIMHHRISLYGEPCKVCGKPLRTPMATYCVACGEPK